MSIILKMKFEIRCYYLIIVLIISPPLLIYRKNCSKSETEVSLSDFIISKAFWYFSIEFLFLWVSVICAWFSLLHASHVYSRGLCKKVDSHVCFFLLKWKSLEYLLKYDRLSSKSYKPYSAVPFNQKLSLWTSVWIFKQ